MLFHSLISFTKKHGSEGQELLTARGLSIKQPSLPCRVLLPKVAWVSIANWVIRLTVATSPFSD